MRIEAVATSPFDRIAYRVATAHGPADALLPFFLATTTQLPEGVDAVIAASDLQGRDDEGRLLGHGACKHLLTLCGTGHLPDPRRVGVVLAGDLWARPALERRGGMGDIREVCEEMASEFAWLIVVAGNHDQIGSGSKLDTRRFTSTAGLHFLDGDSVDVGTRTFAGMSGIERQRPGPFRRTERETTDDLAQLLSARPDVLVLHEGPTDPASPERGSSVVRRVLAGHPDPLLVIHGHKHGTPLHEFGDGPTQALNVHERVVILTRNGQLHQIGE